MADLIQRNTLLRITSALVMAPIAFSAIWLGGWPYMALIIVVSALGAVEWVQLGKRGNSTFLALIGIPYIIIAGLALIWLREGVPMGRDVAIYLFLCVWSVDTGAYIVGRTLGGPKLAPRLSPSKTWSGLFGGIVTAAIIGHGWAWLAGARIPEMALLTGLVIAVVAQAGDIMESALKRRVGAKDSGNIIPGHGGVLDRIDGMLLAAPVFALFHAAIGLKIGWW